MKRIYFLFILIFILTSKIEGQSLTEKKLETKTIEVETPEQEIINYKLLYENQITYNSNILNTIYYSLGGLGAAILFVFASNWWFNEKKVNDIRASISNQISSETNSIKSEVQDEIESKFSDMINSFEEFMEKNRLETREDNNIAALNFQNQLKNLTDSFNLQIQTLRTSIDERINLIQKETENNNSQISNAILLIKKESDISTKKLRMNIASTEASLWLMQKVPTNALRCYFEEAQLCVEVNSLWKIRFIFDSIIALKGQINSIFKSDLRQYKECLELITNKEDLEKKQIIIDWLDSLNSREG